MSSTLVYSNPPWQVQDVLNQQAAFLVSNNVYTTTQTFFGIQNNANSNIAGSLTVTGQATLGPVSCSSLAITGNGSDLGIFSVGTLNVTGATGLQGPLTGTSAVFSGSLQCASELDTGSLQCMSLNVSGASVLQGALSVAGALTGTSAVFSGALQCASELDTGALQCGSLNVSGASTLQGSLTSVAISASGLISGANGLTISNGATSLQACTSTGFIATGTSSFQNVTLNNLTAAGPISGNTLTMSSATNLAGVTCSALTAGSIIDNGALTIAGLTTCNGNLACPGTSSLGVIQYPVAQNTLTYASNIALNLAGFSKQNPFIITAVSGTNWATLTITNAIVNAEFDIFYQGAPSGNVQIAKALSAGGITIYNNLSGNTTAAANSRWLIKGRIISATVCYLDFVNIT